MRPQDIVLGETYRHKSSPSIGYAKAVKILKGKEGENHNSYSVVKCQWTTSRDDDMGLIKHFRPSDLVKET